MASGYELYRHPIQDDTLALVRYCFHKGHRIMPSVTYERNTFLDDENLPAVHSNGIWYCGINQVVQFYAEQCGLPAYDLLERALAFAERHPDFHIHNS